MQNFWILANTAKDESHELVTFIKVSRNRQKLEHHCWRLLAVQWIKESMPHTKKKIRNQYFDQNNTKFDLVEPPLDIAKALSNALRIATTPKQSGIRLPYSVKRPCIYGHLIGTYPSVVNFFLKLIIYDELQLDVNSNSSSSSNSASLVCWIQLTALRASSSVEVVKAMDLSNVITIADDYATVASECLLSHSRIATDRENQYEKNDSYSWEQSGPKIGIGQMFHRPEQIPRLNCMRKMSKGILSFMKSPDPR